ncbi:MAG: hypothetical protein IJW75_00350 [Alphaproteobacteria bacterium]|nr:hypothetical protein [Alphaproteobacteria bacterium]
MVSYDNGADYTFSDKIGRRKNTLLKKIWVALTDNGLYKRLKNSRLNPYHMFLSRVEAENLQQAKKIARAKNYPYLLFRDEKVSTELTCSVEEEFRQYGNVMRGGYDVTNRIPRNRLGQLDLMAEEPIVVAVLPISASSLGGHIAMQYKDKVVNRRNVKMDTDSLFKTYSRVADYYFLYPSQLGIDTAQLEREMEKANVKFGGEYSFFKNNCAKAVHRVFSNLGVKDFKLIVPTPGNNPLGIGIKRWCEKNGVHVNSQEMRDLYKYNDISIQMSKIYGEIRKRYDSSFNSR